MEFIVTTSAKGQVVIPMPIRRRLGLAAGQKVQVTLQGDKIVLTPLPRDPIAALTGLCKGDSSLTEALLQHRKEDQEIETQKFARFLRNAGAVEPGTRLRDDPEVSE